jgi:CHASE1-domain containing sensor protein
MTIQYSYASFVTSLFLFTPNYAFAESTTNPAYVFLGGGLIIVLALAIYVIKQIIYSVRNHCDKRPAK